METKQTIFAIAGKAGAGKGTQAALLSKKLGVAPPLDTGSILRIRRIADPVFEREYGLPFMEAGRLLPAQVVCETVNDALVAAFQKHNMVVIDGFIRKIGQAEHLVAFSQAYHTDVVIIHLDVTNITSLRRCTSRALQDREARQDDADQNIIWERLMEYHRNYLPSILPFCQQHRHVFTRILDIYGESSIEEVTKDICAQLEL